MQIMQFNFSQSSDMLLKLQVQALWVWAAVVTQVAQFDDDLMRCGCCSSTAPLGGCPAGSLSMYQGVGNLLVFVTTSQPYHGLWFYATVYN